jgi:hypothetical protein
MRTFRFIAALVVTGMIAAPAALQAAPYASNITKTGTTVNFILNQNADTLKYSINGGALIDVPTGTTKGAHTFTLGSPTDTFSIVADLNDAAGFTSPTGNTIPALTNSFGQSRPLPEATLNLISDDTNLLTRFNSPRGVSVSFNPNAPNFGTAYVSNSQAANQTSGTAGGRTLTGRGIYALGADQTDIFSYGDTAQQDTLFAPGNSANSPYRVTVGPNGDVYVAGFADALSGVWQMPPNLSSNTQIFAATTGPATLPVGQNHGSVIAVYVEGSIAGGDLVLYTMDEDLTTSIVTGGTGSTTDKSSVWKYTINGAALPYTAMPTKLVGLPAPGATGDIDRGADGKFYVSENRSAGNEAGLLVTDASGTVLWNSFTASQAIPAPATDNRVEADYNTNDVVDGADYVQWRKAKDAGPPLTQADNNEIPDSTGATGTPPFGFGVTNDLDYGLWRARFGRTADILTNLTQIAVSPDQKWLAGMSNGSDVYVLPLVNGLPDLANLRIVDSGNINSGRDIAFDAAGNIHYVSSGQTLYRVLAPGGHTIATTTWNGSAYAFGITTVPGAGSGGAVPETGTIALALMGLFAGGIGRQRRA